MQPRRTLRSSSLRQQYLKKLPVGMSHPWASTIELNPFGFVHHLCVFEVILVFYVVTLVLNYREVLIFVDDIRKNCDINLILEEKV